MHSKVSSDWLPSYIKTTRPVLEIFKMAGYFLDSPHKKLRFSFISIIDRKCKRSATTLITRQTKLWSSYSGTESSPDVRHRWFGDCRRKSRQCLNWESGSRKSVLTERNFMKNYQVVKVKVKQPRNKPGVSQRVPGGLDSQIFMTVGT
jgi:hypothetical protein